MIQIIAARFTNCLAFACIYIELKTIKSTTFPTKILSPNMDAEGLLGLVVNLFWGHKSYVTHVCVCERGRIWFWLWSHKDKFGWIWLLHYCSPRGNFHQPLLASFKWILNTIFKLFTWTDVPLFFGITEQVLVDKKRSK